MSTYNKELAESGFTKISNVLSDGLIIKINKAIDRSYAHCRDIQRKNGLTQITDGTVHHLLSIDESKEKNPPCVILTLCFVERPLGSLAGAVRGLWRGWG